MHVIECTVKVKSKIKFGDDVLIEHLTKFYTVKYARLTIEILHVVA